MRGIKDASGLNVKGMYPQRLLSLFAKIMMKKRTVTLNIIYKYPVIDKE